MPEWRYLAQRVTGEWVHMDLPLRRDELRWDLNGPGSLQATISPEMVGLLGEDEHPLLDEWRTFLYAEADGQIRWGGIIIHSDFNGAAWKIEAAGFSTYASGLPYTGEKWSKLQIDPFTAVRYIWDHIQSQPDGDLGLIVDPPTSDALIGTPAVDNPGTQFDAEAHPYELSWWEAQDLGGELDNLAKETPFDYTETHTWDGDNVRHEIKYGYPRLGRRRTDLVFEQGVNVSAVIPVSRNGDTFVNGMVGLGRGEGRGTTYTTSVERDGRLRRVGVFTDKSIRDKARLRSFCSDEMHARGLRLDIAAITVVDHPNAPIASWEVGDDILIEARLPWLGDVQVWSRITSWALVSDSKATLTVSRSDRFRYRGTTSE